MIDTREAEKSNDTQEGPAVNENRDSSCVLCGGEESRVHLRAFVDVEGKDPESVNSFKSWRGEARWARGALTKATWILRDAIEGFRVCDVTVGDEVDRAGSHATWSVVWFTMAGDGVALGQLPGWSGFRR